MVKLTEVKQVPESLARPKSDLAQPTTGDGNRRQRPRPRPRPATGISELRGFMMPVGLFRWSVSCRDCRSVAHASDPHPAITRAHAHVPNQSHTLHCCTYCVLRTAKVVSGRGCGHNASTYTYAYAYLHAHPCRYFTHHESDLRRGRTWAIRHRCSLSALEAVSQMVRGKQKKTRNLSCPLFDRQNRVI